MQMPIFKLRDDIRLRPQTFGGQLRYVVEDPVSAKFYRIGRREYLIASAMDGKRDLAQVLQFAKASAPELNWSETHTEKAVRWLAGSGLLITDSEKQTAPAGRKINKPRGVDPFFFRIPFIPGSLMESIARRLTWLFSPFIAAASAIVAAVAVLLLMSDFGRFAAFSSELFVPDRWLFWLIAWLLLR